MVKQLTSVCNYYIDWYC